MGGGISPCPLVCTSSYSAPQCFTHQGVTHTIVRVYTNLPDEKTSFLKW